MLFQIPKSWVRAAITALSLTTSSLDLAAAEEQDRGRFITLTEEGALAGLPWDRQSQPRALPLKGYVAEIEVQESGIGDFCEILACHQAEDWTKASPPSGHPTLAPHAFYFYLDGLPAKQSYTFLLQADSEWNIMKVGHFRCFPTTDSAVFYEKVPAGNFVITCLDADKKLSTKRLTLSPALREVKKSWADLEDFKIADKELLQHLERRKLPAGNDNPAK